MINLNTYVIVNVLLKVRTERETMLQYHCVYTFPAAFYLRFAIYSNIALGARIRIHLHGNRNNCRIRAYARAICRYFNKCRGNTVNTERYHNAHLGGPLPPPPRVVAEGLSFAMGTRKRSSMAYDASVGIFPMARIRRLPALSLEAIYKIFKRNIYKKKELSRVYLNLSSQFGLVT